MGRLLVPLHRMMVCKIIILHYQLQNNSFTFSTAFHLKNKYDIEVGSRTLLDEGDSQENYFEALISNQETYNPSSLGFQNRFFLETLFYNSLYLFTVVMLCLSHHCTLVVVRGINVSFMS